MGTKRRRPTPLADFPAQRPGLIMMTVALILLFSIPPVRLAQTSFFAEELDEREFLIHEGDICSTAGCNHSAAVIIENMNASVDPCDNFYEYACGEYPRIDTLYKTSGLITKLHMDAAEAEIQPNEPKTVKMVKTYYKSCINLKMIEARGAEPLLADIRKLGGWPVLDGDAWNETAFDREKTIREFLDNGYYYNYIIKLFVRMTKGASRPDISLKCGRLGLYSYPTKVAYHKKMVDIATKLGGDKNRSMAELWDSVNFEVELSKIAWLLLSPSELITVEDLLKNYSYIPWQEYFRRLIPPTITINLNDSVRLDMPAYFDRLNSLLLRTPKRVQANYLMSRLALDSMMYIRTDKKQRTENAGVPNESIESASRSSQCLAQLRVLSFAFDALITSKYGNQDTLEDIRAMFQNIKLAMKTKFTAASWMDEKIKRRGIAKLDAIKLDIEPVDSRVADNVLEALYGNIEMSEDHYYENSVKAQSFETKLWKCDIYAAVYNISCERSWIPTSYNKTKNIVVVNIIEAHAGFFYSSDRPRYLNYGTLGFAIAHEIAHAVGLNMIDYDENGEESSLPSDSHELYENHTQCIIDQYSDYTVKGIGQNVNGSKTLNENLADYRGSQAAYQSYNDWALMNKDEPRLPGINMTAKQVFWIAFANVGCSRYEAMDLKHILQDEHSPGEFRVIGSFSNMPEFANDFSCPVGSKMNPEKKCSL